MNEKLFSEWKSEFSMSPSFVVRLGRFVCGCCVMPSILISAVDNVVMQWIIGVGTIFDDYKPNIM